ncbi:centromere protein Q isoform X1 [Tachysurus fulvidraco]|uniref:centromere protein Q isoform X1 n=1 Tax=Tachysurus fulvidraco TaxID=1234273 RepID=UPI001FEE4353|nr:centromere protein Q isoform X1 [Tachysurus fulvidraco]XP_047659357.1 centromere protein Q isoform X1 [Tachysurus fulvidraco]
MKPARGSSRASTLGPKCAGRRGKNLQQKPVPEIESTQDKTRKKELRKVKSQEKWKPLDPASIRVIDNMLSLSILHVLPMRSKEKEESQKHLNSLKDQFLAKCSQLPVPPQKHGNLMHLSQQFHSENQKIKNGKKKIEALKERSQELVSQLEQLQGKMDCLENECRVMRNNLEEEELKAQTFIQLADQAVLRLPALPRYPEDEPTLQEKIMKAVPDPKAVMKALQKRKITANVKAFLELAHKQTDHL